MASCTLETAYTLTSARTGFRWKISQRLMEDIDGDAFVLLRACDRLFSRFVCDGGAEDDGSGDGVNSWSMVNHPGYDKLLELRNSAQRESLAPDEPAPRPGVADASGLNRMFGSPSANADAPQPKRRPRGELKTKRMANPSLITFDVGQSSVQCARPVKRNDPLKVRCTIENLCAVVDFIREHGRNVQMFSRATQYVRSGKYKRPRDGDDAPSDVNEDGAPAEEAE